MNSLEITLLLVGLILVLSIVGASVVFSVSGKMYYQSFSEGWDCCYAAFKVGEMIPPSERSALMNSRLSVLGEERAEAALRN